MDFQQRIHFWHTDCGLPEAARAALQTLRVWRNAGREHRDEERWRREGPATEAEAGRLIEALRCSLARCMQLGRGCPDKQVVTRSPSEGAHRAVCSRGAVRGGAGAEAPAHARHRPDGRCTRPCSRAPRLDVRALILRVQSVEGQAVRMFTEDLICANYADL